MSWGKVQQDARQLARSMLPLRLRRTLRCGLNEWRGLAPQSPPAEPSTQKYEQLYESHAQTLPSELSVGDGDFDLVGRVELAVLVQEGLTPSSSLLDFGCGTGRLAVHAIPFLTNGSYVGTDISTTMLSRARGRAAGMTGAAFQFLHQTDEGFPVADNSVDMICAFSVFTHMEHEDTLRYLTAAHRPLRPGGRFVLSCLPIHLRVSKEIFRVSAADGPDDRWTKVRNVVTSTSLIEEVSRLAGWEPMRWHDGEIGSIEVPGADHLMVLGQSVLVLGASGS